MNAMTMTRRAAAHDYTQPGTYHITMHVAEGMGQPLGQIVGDVSVPDGSPDAPRTRLSAVGRMVEQELLHSLHDHYPMVTVQDYVVMPDHLHFLVEVQDKILSIRGKTLPLGQVIAGFKKGCNKRFWALTAQTATENAANTGGQTAAHPAADPAADPAAGTAGQNGGTSGAAAGSVQTGFPGALPRPNKTPSNGTTGRPPLFAYGYCDVMPVTAEQLATQRQYIKDNPRSRLLRSLNRAWLSTQRGAVSTALTVSALRGYLVRECPPSLATAEALSANERRLLVAPGGETAGHAATMNTGTAGHTATMNTGTAGHTATMDTGTAGHTATMNTGTAGHAATMNTGTAGHAVARGGAFIVCDSYGNGGLLTGRGLLPVVCHRKDKALFAQQKARCLEMAAQGAVLVSARIAKGEQEIIDEAVSHGFPVIIIADNGFPERYHPSTERIALCAAGRLLLITPWQYQYRGKNEQVTVPFCKTMNCVAQALCRRKDSWWKE